MNKQNEIEFSKELIEFSKLVNNSFENVSKDIKLLTNKNSDSIKISKLDINNIKKEMIDLKMYFNSVKKTLFEINKKLKKNTSIIPEQKRPITNKEDIKILANEISDMKLRIKNIENKLKIN